MSEILSLINLAPNDIAKLPVGLRERLNASSRSTDTESSAWFLVGGLPEDSAKLIERTIEMLFLLGAERRSQLTEANIEKIVDVILSGAPRVLVENELDIDNAMLRSEYLQEAPLLTGAEVHAASNLNSRNKSEPASRWKREGKLFAVRWRGIDLYPNFQFADGVPRPVIKEVLTALPDGMTGWQMAMWFASGNGWLDGATPQDCLSDPNAVVNAACKLADPAVG